MRRVLFFCLLEGAAAGVGIFAQTPIVYNRAVYNAASFMPAGIPSGAIARGSLFSLFGSNIGPTTPATANAFPLQTTLGNVSVSIIQGNTSVSAIPLYVSGTQINAIMPSNAPLGLASVQVVVGNFKSNLSTVRIANSAFGVFTANGTGLGPGILQNFISQTNQPINSPVTTATLGQVITLWGTGLGPVTFPDNVAPTPGNVATKVELFVGGVSAPILYSGRAPCCSGTDQVVFQIPNNAPTGCWVPIYVRTEGTTVSNFVTIAIDPNGNTCTTDVLPQVTDAYISGKRLAEAMLTRTTNRQDVGVSSTVDITSDFHVEFAFHPSRGPYDFNPALGFPPAGTCTVYTEYGDMVNGGPLPGMPPSTMPLDLGPPLQLTGPRGSKQLSVGFLLARAGYIGGSVSNALLSSSLFLDPGSYTLQGSGGNDVGTFTTPFTIPPQLNWTNRDSVTTVTRSQGLNVSWSGGDTNQNVVVLGIGEDLPTNSSAAFVCMAPKNATSFTVPADILSNLPASRANVLQSKDLIYLIALAGNSVQNIQATGLDVGITSFYYIVGKTVVLQ